MSPRLIQYDHALVRPRPPDALSLDFLGCRPLLPTRYRPVGPPAHRRGAHGRPHTVRR